MIPASLLLLLAAASCVKSNVELTQPGSLTVKPGQSLTISCKVSGYSLTDSYYTGWIRQPAGKALEWIGYMWGGGSTYYKDSLKNKFSITRDTSSNTVSLQGSSLQTEDTAVYYCARWPHVAGGSFDYWGKGTMVTVTSAQQATPDVFPLVSCGSSSEYITAGCIARGFMPDGLSFKWTKDGSDLPGFVQYPSVLSAGKYSSVSQIQLKKEELGESKLQCVADHGGKTTAADVIIQPPPEPTPPTLYLMVPNQEELTEHRTASFACVANQFSPRDHTLTWLRNGKALAPGDGVVTTPDVQEAEGKIFTASSFLRVGERLWKDPGSSISCKFEGKAGTETKSVEYTSGECDIPVEGKILPPSPEEYFLSDTVTLTCNVSCKGQCDVKKFNLTWERADGEPLVGKYVPDDNYRISKIQIRYEEWKNGTEFICIAQHDDSPSPKRIPYKRENGGKSERPSVFLLAPADQHNKEEVTLTCYAKDFYPDLVLISWLADDQVVDRSEFQTTEVVKTGNTYSVYSQLTVPAAAWKSGVLYSCAVHHETVKDRVVRAIIRTSSSVSSTPTTVSLDLNVPQVCKVSYVTMMYEHWGCDTSDIDSDSSANTAITFVFLFLISLFYSIGATAFKGNETRIDPPNITLYHQLSSKTSGATKISLICYLTGYYPEAIRVEWQKDNNPSKLSDNKQVFKKREEKYSLISQVEVNIEDWHSGSEYTCKATHDKKDFSKRISICSDFPVFPPTISLEKPNLESDVSSEKLTATCTVLTPYKTTVSWYRDGDEKNKLSNTRIVSPRVTLYHQLTDKSEATKVSLTCSLTGYYPDDITVEWLVDNNPSNLSEDKQKLQNVKGGETTYSLSSQVKIDIEDWHSGSEYTCKATHNKKDFIERISICSDFPISSPPIYLEAPNLESDVSFEKLTATCTVLTPYKTTVSWFRDGDEKNTLSNTRIVSPRITLYHQLSDKSGTTKVSLTCSLTGYYPDDITVEWLVDNNPSNLSEEKQKLQNVKEGQTTYSLSSQVKIDIEDWHSGSKRRRGGGGSKELRSLTAKGKKLLQRLTVRVQMLWYLLPDGRGDEQSMGGGLAVSEAAIPKPDSDAAAEDALYSLSVEGGVDGRGEAGLLQPPQEVEILLGLIGYGDVECPDTRTASPTITLYHQLSNNPSGATKVSLLCYLTGYYPDDITVEWSVNDRPESLSPVQKKFRNVNGGETLYSLSSQLQIDIDEWHSGSNYTCKATHNKKNYMEHISICSEFPVSSPTIYLEAPNLESDVSYEKLTATYTRTVSPRIALYHQLINNPSEATKVSLICYLTGYYPDDITVEWSVNDSPVSLSPVRKKFRNVDGGYTTYSLSSQVEVDIDEWHSGSKYTCKATHNKIDVKEHISICSDTRTASPNIALYHQLSNKTSQATKVSLLCYLTGYYPQDITVEWLVNNKPVSFSTVQKKFRNVDKGDTTYSLSSQVVVDIEDWHSGYKYTCKATHNKKDFIEHISICSVNPTSTQTAEMFLLGPSIHTTLNREDLPFTCLLVAYGMQNFSITWKVNGEAGQTHSTTERTQNANGTQTWRSTFTMKARDWHMHKNVSCEARHVCSSKPQLMSLEKARDPKQPSVQILEPSESELAKSSEATIVCLVSNFFPSDIDVYWELNKQKLPESRYSSSPALRYSGKSSYSMHSKLLVPKSQWKDGEYSCVVRHESSKSPLRHTISNVFASVIPSPPQATLLRSSTELVCLVYGFSPSAINVSWILSDDTQLVEQNTTAASRGPDGRFTIRSHMRPSFWKPGVTYSCRVEHVTTTLLLNISQQEVIREDDYFDENTHDMSSVESAEEIWNTARTFLILFLIAVLYSSFVTLVKVK
ncbi:uncharacterized protein LOC118791307 [Megalops cyprinoides]|uniref:uncharacterized protein LOC118791307 n=1 Tax=Megalops cyprinoides TaxID=118141 RepID=UPI001864C03B|nr:uncharacterized protein LOC118791307 [Megalops cyprinoides]